MLTLNHHRRALLLPQPGGTVCSRQEPITEQTMKTQPTAFDRISYAIKLPFNIFADDEDRVLTRLDEMHKAMPQSLPAKRFFKH
jgi:hypothetical protein